ncbi:MAG: PP2C family protein-serine/threonine phosphatase [Acidobacteria bacterium]|nr:PP2C family protein-serine/threonine phosphatase [Acidobacteriota bacterium]
MDRGPRALRILDVMDTDRREDDFFEVYTKDLTGEDVQRLFTRDARDAYRFFTRHIDEGAFAGLPPLQRFTLRARLVFLAFTLKLSPARRALFGIALVATVVGLIELFEGIGLVRVPVVPFLVSVPLPSLVWSDGTGWLAIGFVLVNLLVLLEVADRLSLKNDLEVAREIQLAMLPQKIHAIRGLEAAGRTRPANTVGGDCYDILRLPEGRLLLMLGDVSGKGSPAALLMALAIAMLRTLAAENLTLVGLMERLNRLVYEQTPGSRFITMFVAAIDPATWTLTYINAGQTPPLLRRQAGEIEALATGGIALGMFDRATYEAAELTLDPGDLLVAYSDGVTEAESPAGVPFDEIGLRHLIETHHADGLDDLGEAIVAAVVAHADSARLADDLTVLAARRLPPVPPGV